MRALLTAILLAGAPGPRPVPDLPKTGQVTIVSISGTIDLGLSPYLERLAKAQGENDVLVLDINTLGGRVDAAIVIRDALLHTRGKTVCYVNPRAISAGALISLACDVIAVAPGATIGAATPVQVGQGGEMKPVEEKVVSYMSKEMRATAEAKGRSGTIAEAMVDADLAVEGLDEKGKLLTLDGKQAIAWGIAELEAANLEDLLGKLQLTGATIRRPTLSWAEQIARFLSDPVFSGILMTLGMLGILIELYSPGHGVALGFGLLCLGLFFFGHHIVSLAGWEEILLFVVGVVLVGIEVFVPGHVLPGVIGALCIVASLVLALVNLDAVPFEVAWRAGWITRALALVMGSVVATALVGWGAMKVLPKTTFGRPLILEARLPPGDGRDPLEGETGEAATPLRPAGKVVVGGKRLDAVAEVGYVEAGARIRVVRAEAGRLVVREERPEEKVT